MGRDEVSGWVAVHSALTGFVFYGRLLNNSRLTFPSPYTPIFFLCFCPLLSFLPALLLNLEEAD